MDARTIAAPAAADNLDLPDAKRRLIQIDDALAKIRAQFAAADLVRQAERKAIDPHWFHRAKTAQRHLQRERSEIVARLAATPVRKDSFKDALIAILRERHDAAAWTAILQEAHRRVCGEAR